jgi:hypothetical protein
LVHESAFVAHGLPSEGGALTTYWPTTRTFCRRLNSRTSATKSNHVFSFFVLFRDFFIVRPQR